MKVSVITPFYNGNKYIHDYENMMAANERSLMPQDVLEVILVNDSPEVAVELSGIYASRPNWRVIANQKNVGIHASRIHGLSEASGDYVIFLDQDDFLAEDAVAIMLEEARRIAKEASQRLCYKVLVANALLQQRDGSKVPWYRSDYHKNQIGRLRTYLTVGTQIISPGQCMMAKEIIPREWITHVVTKNGADDYYLWLLLLEKGIDFEYVDDTLYEHSMTEENLSLDTTVTDTSTAQFIGYLYESGFPERQLKLLDRQTKYKHDFRKGTLTKKLLLSLRYFDIFIANVIFKLRSRTAYGFNR